ncbi:MAG TPA: carboxymuconolactone decarboxylase family protein [Thermoanaerobaculia bacterium]|nr:carboxymuconolactone decarboxylase family protein [Thermoanaerobaculia bacterium]
MEHLTPRDRELVALGAALGSNCIPCAEYHVAEGRKVGLSPRQIAEALRLADKLRQTPADRVLAAANAALAATAAPHEPIEATPA